MRVLVVEQEARIRTFLARAFEAEGFGVGVAQDGDQAIEQALSSDYGEVILDLLQPAGDGWKVLAELHRQRPGLPVLILSTRGDISTKLRGFQLGAVDFLAKPFSLDELLARARVHLRRDPGIGAEETVIHARDLTLDLARRQARTGETVAVLSDREFRLLHFLMRHAGEVISRERLLSEVWGLHFDPRSNVVDVCVGRLRRQLGPDSPIETVRNVGYRAAA